MTTEMRPWFAPNHERYATRRAVVALGCFVAACAALIIAVATVEWSDEGLYVLQPEVALGWPLVVLGLGLGSLVTAFFTYGGLKDEWHHRAEWFAAKAGVTRLLIAALLVILTVPAALWALWIGHVQRTVVPTNSWQFLAGLTAGEWVLAGVGLLMLVLAYRYISWRWSEAFADFNEAE
jgi:hypothetical protein